MTYYGAMHCIDNSYTFFEQPHALKSPHPDREMEVQRGHEVETQPASKHAQTPALSLNTVQRQSRPTAPQAYWGPRVRGSTDLAV